ncbi:MAG: alkaline phosphatase family protein [Saprospiraceae bacterium]|nr:alkaline phosphatase family protein [Saprospiraceae bacterium]
MKRPLVIVYLVDGARPDVMQELIESGDLPNIKKEVLGQGTFRMASSCFPSTTGPAYLPFLTGSFPGTSNIPGIRWLDKRLFSQKRWGRNSFRSYCGYEAPYFNDDLPKDRPTLHELFDRPFNIFSMITRGLPEGHDLTKKVKPGLYLHAHLSHKWEKVDHASHEHLMLGLDQDPEFMFVVFPGVDSNSHLHHPHHENTIKAYKYVDYSVGKAVEKLKKQGRWDETLMILISDHGLTATHTHLDLARFFKQKRIKTLEYPIIWTHRPKMSVMISGNAAGQVYCLQKPDGGPMYGAEIQTLLGDVWHELLAREEVDFITWRHDERTFAVGSNAGEAWIRSHPEGLVYLPQSGDPLGLGTLDTPLDRQQALEATFHSDYPDALVQIEQLFSCTRTGDFVVTSKKGYDLREVWEWPEHHGSHGSLHREHMLVPFIYNQTGWDERSARTTDVFNTILKWAGRPTLDNTDGKPLC